MKIINVAGMFGEELCHLSVGMYSNNNHIQLQLWCKDGPYATLTVNLPQTRKYPPNYGFVDINNFPQGEALIRKMGIGKRVRNGVATSGFCAYPLYEFDLDAITKWIVEE